MAENERMEKTIAALKESFNGIRTGRASASIFDRVRVDYYGQKSPLSQVATVSIPEARSVIINPFDKSLITEIEKAGNILYVLASNNLYAYNCKKPPAQGRRPFRVTPGDAGRRLPIPAGRSA